MFILVFLIIVKYSYSYAVCFQAEIRVKITKFSWRLRLPVDPPTVFETNQTGSAMPC